LIFGFKLGGFVRFTLEERELNAC